LKIATGVAQPDRQLVADEFAAAVGEDGRTTGEACSVLLAFAGRRAPESEAVRQHAENDCGTAAAGRVAEQKRKSIGSEVIQWAQVLAEKRGGGTKHSRRISGAANASRDATQKRPW